MESLEERLEFLSRWTDVLRGRITYWWPCGMERVWEQDRHFLKVLAPARFEHENVEKELSKKKENEFLAHLQHFREALALLSAVGHVDKAAWRYLLEHHCDVELEVEGDEVFEEEIPVRFQLDLLKGKTKYTYPKKVKDDLVRWFGTAQRTEASEDFLETLQQIADLAGNLPTDKPGLDLVIPVNVWFSLAITDGGDMKPLEDIWIAEMVVQKKWEAFDDVDVELGSLRCTYKLEPMAAGFGDTPLTSEGVHLLKTLVWDNVRFATVSIWPSLVDEREEDAFAAAQKFGELMRCIFGSGRRPRDVGTIYPADEMSPLQIGSIDLSCVYKHPYEDNDRRFAAMCSALVTNQASKHFTMSMYLRDAISDHVDGAHMWKWLAYAFFSKRARQSSATESLAIIGLDNLSVANVEAFVSILSSNHPEEDLCGCPRGRVPERDATLKDRSPIYWRLTSSGQPDDDFDPLVFTTSIRSVRTFSDDGESDLVNAMVPGFGRCLVRRSDLVFSGTEAPITANQGGISSFFLVCGGREHFDVGGLRLLLDAVGVSLKKLTLNGPDREIDINMILRSCPNLSELAHWRRRGVIRLNFGCYQARMQPLPVLDGDWDDVGGLVTRLSDVSSPLAKCARRLRLNLWNQDGRQVDEDHTDSTDIDKTADMLEVNDNLEYLDVVVQDYSPAEFNKLRQFHRTPGSRALALSAACKAAFLSVFPGYVLNQTSKRGCTDAAPWWLDEDVLSSILAFAAPPVLRQIYVRKPRTYVEEGHDTSFLI